MPIRSANAEDVPALCALIEELAAYEKLTTRIDPRAMAAHLFGPRPFAEVLLAEADARVEGYALFFHTYSTFLSKPGIYLEDLFVRESARGRGLGLALLGAVRDLAMARGCGRLEWSVLDWNSPAIAFYERFGAKRLDGWSMMRMTLSAD